MAAAQAWKPYESLTTPPTNLKEAIDWVLRVTGRDGKKNAPAAQQPPQSSTSNGPHCLCFLAKAVKDLLYDARSPGSPGPIPDRYWDDLLLGQEKDIVKPVLTDLGLLSGGSTSAASSTCSGGTEVIKALIDHLALGLQKWVGWQEGDTCCLKGTNGIGGKCNCSPGVGCCGNSGKTCHDCTECGTGAKGAGTKCYLSAYCKATSPPSSSPENYLWTTLSDKADQVHLLARIFLGSVCLIWSGLSQLGFLTGGSGDRWTASKLHEISGDSAGLGSFMAAMGYDLERLNGSGSKGNTGNGEFVQKLLSGKQPNGKEGIQWNEFQGDSAEKNSVAEYYSTIYDKAKEALKKDNKTESICNDYPLLVLHILASGYFRAGSAGAKGITSPPKAPQPAPSAAPSPTTDTTKKEKSPRKPRTIREILYWLSALPYSKGYRELVDRMQDKYPRKEDDPEKTEDKIEIHGQGNGASTTLKRDDITHYLMAACGYCPLVLIGIQGTIEKEVDKAQAPPGGPAAAAKDKKCPEHSKDRSRPSLLRRVPPGSLQVWPPPWDVRQWALWLPDGPFGRPVPGPTEVLGWKSCRYGKGVNPSGGYSPNEKWLCEAPVGPGGAGGNDCQCKKSASHKSPLMLFLCDGLGPLVCGVTAGKAPDNETNTYPEIKDHMEAKDDIGPKHFGGLPIHCPVPMGWQAEASTTGSDQNRVNHFKDLTTGSHKTASLQPSAGQGTYPAHCTGNTLSLLLEYYCDPVKCPSGSLVVLLRLLACITPTVPRTLGDLFGFYYYIVYIGGKSGGGKDGVNTKLTEFEKESKLHMPSIGGGNNAVVQALTKWNGDCSGGTSGCKDTLKCLYGGKDPSKCNPYLSPLSGQQYGQLSPAMAGTYLSWLVCLIGEFNTGVS
ncbi:variant erythrocyte surface antigen-1 beta subunit [Babesia bovis T2Bo]|uniref:variant erythrocyte surface antigen-1 beta subunit n=1 Tax=Babesia bovis T2Bo TaxID=484906 RepID=UPI001C35CA67|nr:variant erythrocyte surface antigen-1 beta subunit [Babesia bovis T2Bo]EDO05971.2 variant erythrocyte surface antigen-1 beta subunit [Babesia bovis T2Bo]